VEGLDRKARSRESQKQRQKPERKVRNGSARYAKKAKAKALTQRARWMRGGQKHPTLHPIEQRMLAGDPGLPDDETVGRGWGTLRPEMPPLLLVMRPTEECVH